MNLAFLSLCLLLFVVLGLGVVRLGRGPTTLDRMIGFDLLTITIVGLVLVFSAATGATDFIEFVLILSGLGFLTTVAYFFYLTRMNPEDEDFDLERRRP